MPPSDDFLSSLLRLRADAVFFVLLATAACVWCNLRLRRRASGAKIPAKTWISAGLVLAAGLVFSETLATRVTFAGLSPAASALLARAVPLGGAALIIAILLCSYSLVVILRREIHERRETEAQLERAKSEADAANRAKSDFLAVMSHEIRTPLNAVIGFANLLSETRLDEAQRDYLSTINTESRRLTSLISDILDLTKIEQGRLALERLPFSPVETGQEVMRLLAPKAHEKKIDLRFEAQLAGPLLVAGDPLRFRQVLLNLVDNAVKFTSTGSVTLFLAWKAPSPGDTLGELSVRVHDTGVGIPAEKLKDLFQMFMQVDTSTTRKFGGTGLGLAICHRLVGLMGGEITAASSREAGTEFSFSLPVHVVAAPEESSHGRLETPFPAGRQPRILVVDDMQTNRFLLEVFLSRHGFTPELAAGGEEAVRLATSRQYDAILMDLQMPDLDGFAATERIRAQETAGRHTPIIALTASITKGTREKCLARGMDAYLPKPLDLRQFKTILNQLLTNAASVMPPAQPPVESPGTAQPSEPRQA